MVLTREIVARTLPDRAPSRVPLVLAVILSAQFFLDNFHHVQMNEVTFVLALFGIRAYLDGRDVTSAAAFVAATALKITPIFFAAWLVIRGRRRAALAVFPIALGCLLVPMVLRGPSRGAAELREYYHKFLEKHQHGEIGEYRAGQNIAALVSRMTRAPEAPGEPSYQWAPATEPASQLAYRSLAGDDLRDGPPAEPDHVHDPPGPLAVLFATVLSVRPAALRGPARVVALGIGIGMAVCGLSGRDLVGGALYLAVGGYSVCAWVILALFGVTLVCAGRPGALTAPRPGA